MRIRGLGVFFFFLSIFPSFSSACVELFETEVITSSSPQMRVKPWWVVRSSEDGVTPMKQDIPAFHTEGNLLPHWDSNFQWFGEKGGGVYRLTQPLTQLEKRDWVSATYQSKLRTGFRIVDVKEGDVVFFSRWETTFDGKSTPSELEGNRVVKKTTRFRVKLIHLLKPREKEEDGMDELFRVEFWNENDLQNEAPSFSFYLKNSMKIDRILEKFQVLEQKAKTPDFVYLIASKLGEMQESKDPTQEEFLQKFIKTFPNLSGVLY